MLQRHRTSVSHIKLQQSSFQGGSSPIYIYAIRLWKILDPKDLNRRRQVFAVTFTKNFKINFTMGSLGNISINPTTISTTDSAFPGDINGTITEGNLTDTLKWLGKTVEGSFKRRNDAEEETFYPQCYYYDIVNMITVNTILFVFGTFGNILIIFVMWTDAKKHITSFLLANLAVSDTFVLTTYWFFQSPKVIAEKLQCHDILC